MEKIPGISVSVSNEGDTIQIGNNGYLCLRGKPNPTMRLMLKIVVLPQEKWIRAVFTVDQAKQLVPIRRQPDWLYEHCIEILEDRVGTPYASYPKNHVKILELTLGGELKIWEIAVVSQNGQFFLMIQNTYIATCYQDGAGNVVCPKLEKWQQFLDALKNILNGRSNGLLSINAYQQEKDVRDNNLLTLPDNTGLVLWWNNAMGMGAIATKQGPARVHRLRIKSTSRFPSFLVPGEVVEYKNLRPVTNRNATSFEQEAMEVTM